MAYIISSQNVFGQSDNDGSSPVVISQDQIGSNQLASEEALILLRRLVKICESSAVTDNSLRQRVVVDALPTLAAVTTVSTVSNIGTVAGHGLQQFVDIARNAYANGIRSKLIFS